MNRILSSALSVLFLFAGAGILRAYEPSKNPHFPADTNRSRVWSGFGYLNARAGEFVYGPGGTNNKVSHLVWDVNHALTYNLGFDGEINDRWSFFSDFVTSAVSDNSHMVDYDWLVPNAPWTHRSLHPNTELNHYFQYDGGLDFVALGSDAFKVHVRGGFRYTDISMDAYGGSYVYSNLGFRDSRGVFPGNQLGISYRQKLPGVYLAPRIEWAPTTRLNFNIGGTIGTTFNAEARDHHWQRRLLFVDHLNRSAFYGASLGIDYRIRPNTTLYVEGSYDKYRRTEGYTEIRRGFAQGFTGPDTSGAELKTTQIKAGIRIEGHKKRLFKQDPPKERIFR